MGGKNNRIQHPIGSDWCTDRMLCILALYHGNFSFYYRLSLDRKQHPRHYFYLLIPQLELIIGGIIWSFSSSKTQITNLYNFRSGWKTFGQLFWWPVIRIRFMEVDNLLFLSIGQHSWQPLRSKIFLLHCQKALYPFLALNFPITNRKTILLFEKKINGSYRNYTL